MYRFEEIAGNEQIIKNIKSAISAKKFSHAYIIQAEQGMGKKLLANTFAKTLQCVEKGKKPCENCQSCRVYESGNHPDVFFVRPMKTKSIGVEDIREQVVDIADIKPYQFSYKIFIIEKADTMTVQAQNALLKTLEEPPAYGVFFLLVSSIERILPTVVSRCAVLKLRPLSYDVIIKYLKDNAIGQKGEEDICAQYAQGSIGRAIEYAQSEEFGQMRKSVISWLIELQKKDIVSVMAIAKEMEAYKENTQFLDMASLWYRDVLVAKKLKNSHFLIEKDSLNMIFEQAENETEIGLFQKIEAIRQAKSQIAKNGNFQLAMEVMLLKLKESSHR